MVVEHGAIARLFERGTHPRLQRLLVQRVTPRQLSRLRSRDAYDRWLDALVCSKCWSSCSRNGLKADRWAYIAKAVNILIYEIASNRKLLDDKSWRRLRPWLHVPLDSRVFDGFREGCDTHFEPPKRLKGMSRRQYLEIQRRMRSWAAQQAVAPIVIEDYWASHQATQTVRRRSNLKEEA